jgi:hypothetical protein
MSKEEFFVNVSDLPHNLKLALQNVGYGKSNVRIVVGSEFYPRPPSMDGRRGYLAVVNLNEGAADPIQVTLGSYGGANMFVKSVDDFEGKAAIPNNFAAITGLASGGSGYPTTATIYVGPGNMNPALLPQAPSVSEREAKILYMTKAYKSKYRADRFRSLKVLDSEIDSLVSRGFIKKNAAGHLSITTDGRNAAAKNEY